MWAGESLVGLATVWWSESNPGAAAALLSTVAWFCWRGRLSWRAPRAQQREAERELAAKTNP